MTAPPDSTTPEVQLSSPCNFRDLGGHLTATGTVRTGRVYRSDDVATTTPEFATSMLDEHGVGHVIDLRSANEVAFTGRGPLASLPVTYHHLPLIDRYTPRLERPPATAEEMGRGYVHMVENAASRLAMALQLVAAADRAVVFHCAAGKDRTGVLAALLLSVLEVDPVDIVADYTRTDEVMPQVNTRLAPLIAAAHANGRSEPLADDHPLLRAPAVSMTEFLQVMTERHGHPLSPLRAAGLTFDIEQRLRERLVAEG
ncbi:tyrosine-protein phosphatase [Lipingzhangella sp. LS1_29]|uniref:Tyrosine-protein phosphatase n=1 Tax=Lipingzhangella rawalii TaxID=2055835 RepID=A0ABU2H1X8_9ACTN|nr:tyrosine-protein phosphatase [Lipingzhangella rawalii]MDS1269298.1 tyrosine-protein phosphatase [Lipingzhangella rawalii]